MVAASARIGWPGGGGVLWVDRARDVPSGSIWNNFLNIITVQPKTKIVALYYRKLIKSKSTQLIFLSNLDFLNNNRLI
jgi:hypothetical protein